MTSEKKPEQQGPDNVVPETTLREDFGKVVDKAKDTVNPKTMAVEAGATASGLNGALDALKTAKGGAEAQKELDKEPVRRDADAAETDSQGPTQPAASPTAPDKRKASLYAMDDGSGGTADGAIGGPAPVGSAPDQGFGASTPSKPKKPDQHDNSKQSKTPGSRLRNGSAKGLDAAGKRVGAKDAGKFVRGSDSDGSRTGDVKSAASGAASGAKIGAAFAGVGAVPGALVGGAIQGMKTKRGRRAILGIGILPLLPVLLLFGVALLLVVSMLISSANIGAMSTQDAGAAIEVASADGVPYSLQGAYQDSASHAHVPWEILAATVYVQGGQPSDEEQPSLEENEVKEALKKNSTVGPFKILAKDAEKSAKKHGVGFDLANMPSLRPSSDFVASTLHQLLRDEVSGTSIDDKIETFSLNIGVVLGPKDDDEETGGDQARYIDGDDPSGNDLGTDTYGTGGSDDYAVLREVFIAAIGRLPVEDAATNASRIYDIAMMWHLGRSVRCNVNTASGAPIEGGWANPLVGPISSKYGMRLHPVHGVYKLHDGTDISQTTGTPVYAASSGTVTVGGADAGWGGPHTVLIDHGNGIKTVYGHLSASDVTSGASVSAGQLIGKVGSLGYSTGPHLHYTVRQNDKPVDPVPFMKERGIELGVTPSDQVVGGSEGVAGDNISGGGGEVGDGNSLPASVPGGTSTAVTGSITITQANIKQSGGMAAYNASIPTVLARQPDFVSLNEMAQRSMKTILSKAPGYDGFRSTFPPDPGQRGNENGAVILWKKDTWTPIAKGRIKIVDDDHVMFRGSVKVWDRYAQWVLMERSDGAIVGFIATHHMTNPAYGGPNKPKRQRQYAEGMDKLIGLINVLNQHGPVFMAGDMNTRAAQSNTDWAAIPKMKAIGYQWASHSVDFVFGPPGVTKIGDWNGPMASDHNWVTGKWSMNGVKAGSPLTQTGTVASLPQTWTGKNSLGEEITLERKQLEYAAAIVAKANEMGLGDNAAIVALMTVFVESHFKIYANDGSDTANIGHAGMTAEHLRVAATSMNLPHDAVGSDHDSVGLFQQRYSWGSVPDRMDPDKSAGFFYERLTSKAGWETMPKGNAAQAVQVSAFPDRYAVWETPATELLTLVKGADFGSGDECATMSGTSMDGYTIATLNVLGFNHTAGEGGRRGYESGEIRFPKAMAALDDAGVSVAALQEMHPQDQTRFRADFADEWGSAEGSQDFVIWRKSEWRQVQMQKVMTTYFGGHKRAQPFVLLEQIATGEKIWFMGIHNPANARGPGLKWRVQALAAEKAAIESVKDDGYPVFIAGDFNDVHDGKQMAQCVLTPMMTNVFGEGGPGTCGKPKGAAAVDHIFHMNAPAVGDAKVDKSVIDEKVTDHPLVTAVVGDSSASGNKAVEWALRQVGKGYSQAQDLRLGPTHYDCSGLVYMAWKQAGITLPKTSAAQAEFGTQIDRDELQPGDLIFYRSPVSHVSMYIGERNGTPMMVHAANPSKGVEIVPLSYMAAEEVGYRRVAN